MSFHKRHILAIEPYFGGSHRSFLEGVIAKSQHDWTLVTGKPRHWKWRMRSAPLELVSEVREAVSQAEHTGKRAPEVLFCSDMLDLPLWRGLSSSFHCEQEKGSDAQTPLPWELPAVVYFHENQWTYPVASRAKPDFHYGYTNLLTAIAANACWFNSQHNRTEFLEASEAFVRRIPDGKTCHDFEQLRRKSLVIAPGFEPVSGQRKDSESETMRIGWVSRWEEDKRPDLFADLLDQLASTSLPFELVLLGGRSTSPDVAHQRIVTSHSNRIRYDGFAQDTLEYQAKLLEMDVVVSTAAHEFFGIAICEAVSAGAVPIVPDDLSYRELFPNSCRYESIEQAVKLICSLDTLKRRNELNRACNQQLEPMTLDRVVTRMDEALAQMVQSTP